MGIDLAVEQESLPFRAIVSVCLSKRQVYRQEHMRIFLFLHSVLSSSLKFPVIGKSAEPMLNDLAIHRAAPLHAIAQDVTYL